ncbi:unnamed protein product [Prorocentrum cordatum]|uniref:Uncharacterized protein n=1 Tax=Prorocentrum cordatum TaxID=2364126 RepID=A0ABN9U014_9DINO|nr:unnamed protein product [Polarella glacialis]
MPTRDEKAADKQAEAIVASLAHAGSAATEQAISSVCEVLRKDVALLYHVNALLHNDEWRAVLKASAEGQCGAKPEGPPPEDVGKKLRVGIKKFGHLSRRWVEEGGQNGLVEHLLHAIEPEIFPKDEPADAWYKDCKLEVLCFALRVSMDTQTPNVIYEGMETWTSLGTAISQHYTGIGSPLKGKTSAEILRGYFDPQEAEDNSWNLTCILDTKAEKSVVKVEAGDLTVENPFDWTTDLLLATGTRTHRIQSVHEEFAALNVPMPTATSVKWQGDLFKTLKQVATPKDKGISAASSASGVKRPSPSPPSGAGVAEALRRRLNAKSTGAKGN